MKICTDLTGNFQWKATKIIPERKELSYRERIAAMNFPILEKRVMTITKFNFLNQSEKADNEKFFEICRERSTKKRVTKLKKT